MKMLKLLTSALFVFLFFGFALSVEHCADDDRVTIYETEIPGTIEYIKWDGGDTIYVLTSLNVLYRSEDEGQSWVEETSKLQRAKGGVVNAVSITEVITTTTEITYLKGSTSEIWTTNNGGNTYTYSNALDKMNQTIFGWFQVNPSNPKQIAVRTASRGCFYYNSGDCYFSLYVSVDSANTWSLVSAYNRFSYWGNTDKTTQQTKLFFDVSAQTTGPQSGDDYNLYKTVDYGVTSQLIMDNTAGFVVKNGGLYVAHMEGTELTLLIGANNGDSDLRSAQLPEELEQTRYTILTTDDKFAFINVEHGVDDWGNLYVSGPDQINYALSLSNNKRDPTGHVDFFPIESIRGIFLTNYYESYDANNENDYVKTVITYNKGGEWATLEPPRVDSQGNPITCIQCSLHLLGVNREYVNDGPAWGPILSTKNAIGLIMATGNVGQYLSYDIEDANTYFSRDAGLTWVEVAKGSYVYEFADHGSLILMAKNTEETNAVMYTWNEGLNWTECRFSDPTTSFQVEKIVADPDSTGLGFLLYGTKTTNQGNIGVIIWADFSGFQPRECVKPDDYEVWSPTDETRRNCILGETIQVTRRKQNATCFNADAFEVERIVARCPCAQEDYECDYCYAASEVDDSQCVQVCEPQVPADCNGYYNVSRGYRLVAGDICDYENGLNLLPLPAKCPASTTGLSSSSIHHRKNVAAAVLAIVLTVGAAIIFVGFIIFIKKNERFRNAVFAKLPGRVKDRFGGVAFTRVGENNHLEDDIEQEAKLLDDDDINHNFQKHPDDN